MIQPFDQAEREAPTLRSVDQTSRTMACSAFGKHGMSAIPVTRRLVIFGYITEETDDAERQRFMRVVPVPARLAYKLIGHGQFTRATTSIRGSVSA